MKRVFFAILIGILVAATAIVPAQAAAEAEIEVYLGGTQLGICTVRDGLVVMGFAPVRAEGDCPALDAGLAVGDVLIAIDGHVVRTRADVQQCLALAAGRGVDMTVMRDGVRKDMLATPVLRDGQYLLGVYLRDGVEGIGTLTYVRCDTHGFGALGHAIENLDTGEPAMLYHAIAYKTKVTDVVKGVRGTPGELKAPVGGDEVGTVTKNTALGVYGQAEPAMYEGLERVKVGGRQHVHEGDAVLVCALGEDNPRYYAVRIVQCQRQSLPAAKGMRIRVTDPRLLALTGGIVQGMSGSPIMQDGRLIGAVTHVTVDDPAEGYGVYVDFMLATHG